MQVKKRAIFYIGGYDPKSPDAFYDRLHREAARFETLWETSVSPGARSKHGADVTIEKLKTKGDSWQVETDFHFLTLDDIVLKDFAQPLWKRVGRSLITTADYVLSGTAFKFARHAWRFCLYFAYPPLALLATLLIALAVSVWVAATPLPFATVLSFAAFAVVFILAVHFFWKRRFVLHLMDLWSFSRDFARQRRTDIEDKLNNFARLTVSKVKSENYDEVILVGHSTGGALILDAAGRAAEIDPQLATRSKVSVMTVGSTSLKIGLHPAAGWFRERLQNLFVSPQMNWVEYQCRTDIINFHKTDPAALMNLDMGETKHPIVRDIRIKNMVSPETYKRIRRNFFRVHYQFVFGNTEKYHYDFLAICLGPLPLMDRANAPEHTIPELLPAANNRSKD